MANKNFTPKGCTPMKRIIARFKKTPEGFCCGDKDYLGMKRFLEKLENTDLPQYWVDARNDVKYEIEVIKAFVKIRLKPGKKIPVRSE